MLRRLSGAGMVAIIAIAALLVVTMAESFRFAPDPSADSVFIARAQHVSAPGLNVSISALGPEESRRSFGASLATYGIQPIWLAIENDTDEEMFFHPIATDQDYFSPYEVSFRTHGFFSFAANNERDAFFLRRQIPGKIPPRSRITGFVYGQLDAGIKTTQVWITGKDRDQTFNFTLEAPGPAFRSLSSLQRNECRYANLYQQRRPRNCSTCSALGGSEQGLRAAVGERPSSGEYVVSARGALPRQDAATNHGVPVRASVRQCG